VHNEAQRSPAPVHNSTGGGVNTGLLMFAGARGRARVACGWRARVQVAQRTAAHCEALVKQLQEAKEELLTTRSKSTAAPHEEEEQSSGREAMSMDNLKAMQQRLARETELKEQALAEMQVNSCVRLPAGGRAAPSSSVDACDRS
jgi:hypothetical protein